jgi:formylglycine-generating enzyme required for sulfatase activity
MATLSESESLTWTAGASEVKVDGDRKRILGEFGGGVRGSMKTDLNGEPSELFGLLGSSASLEVQAKAGLGYTGESEWSTTKRTESERAAESVRKGIREAQIDKPYVAVWIEFRNPSTDGLKLIPGTLPIYVGDEPIVNASYEGNASPSAVDPVLIPAKRDKVPLRFKADLDTTATVRLLAGMEEAPLGAFLERSSMTIRDPRGVDAVSAAKQIEDKTVQLSVYDGKYTSSWRVAYVKGESRQPVTLRQAFESVNARLERELRLGKLFVIEDGGITSILGFGRDTSEGRWSLTIGGRAVTDWSAAELDRPLRFGAPIRFSFSPRYTADWATVVSFDPDPAVVTDARARIRMAATGLPWKVRDKKTGIVMLLCPPGEFTMGSPESERLRYDDEVQHGRVIRNAFYLSETEVTQDVWQTHMGANPSYFLGATKPVEQVSWNDCVRFCESTDLRLPTEAEWEYACRAGTTGAYAGDLASMAWFADNSGKKPLDADALFWRDQGNYPQTLVDNGCQSHPVRQRKPNAWGLYDMHGNVWEWVEDGYAEYPKGGGSEEAARFAEGGVRVLRGGGWDFNASSCRAANRHCFVPGSAGNGVFGFRVARTPD